MKLVCIEHICHTWIEVAVAVATVLTGLGTIAIGIGAVVALVQGRNQAKYSEEQAKALNSILLAHNESIAEQAGGQTPRGEVPLSDADETAAGEIAPPELLPRFHLASVRTGRSTYQLVIMNMGDGTARNVQIDMTDGRPTSEQNSREFQSPLVGPTEHPLIRPQEQWRLPLAVSLATPRFLEWTLRWANLDDSDGFDEGIVAL